MRGQWFIDGTWLPLEEDESDHIETEYLARFRGQQMRDTYEMEMVTTTVDSKDAIYSLKLSRSHVDWHSVDEVYLYSDATTSKIARSVTQKLGFSKGIWTMSQDIDKRRYLMEYLVEPFTSMSNSLKNLTWSHFYNNWNETQGQRSPMNLRYDADMEVLYGQVNNLISFDTCSISP
ncbi:hypothetical protein VZT92_012459 [Zoarces viviparus]|uniref:Uncharacterized protein n=1 Tax=Zoarces viviparus TaxID=48416 RepID=A0AAW1F8C3_ZOAVI